MNTGSPTARWPTCLPRVPTDEASAADAHRGRRTVRRIKAVNTGRTKVKAPARVAEYGPVLRTRVQLDLRLSPGARLRTASDDAIDDHRPREHIVGLENVLEHGEHSLPLRPVGHEMVVELPHAPDDHVI